MIVLLAAAAASALAPPMPPSRPWITISDLPAGTSDDGSAAVELVVSPEGRPDSCKLIASTGSGKTDRLICFLAMRRARFGPALDASGKPAYGIHRSPISLFAIGDRPDVGDVVALPPDVELSVRQLPHDARQASVAVVVAVDRGGAVTACAGRPGEDAGLAAAACGAIPAAWQQLPARNAAGEAIAYVTALKVQFSAEQGGSS